MGSNVSCSADEYINGDNNLPVCLELDDDKWEENFLDSLTEPTGEEAESDDEDILPPPPLRFKTYKEAFQVLEAYDAFRLWLVHLHEYPPGLSRAENCHLLR